MVLLMKACSKVKNTLLAVLVLSIVLIVASTIGIAGWEFSNSDMFCAKVCHDVHPEEPYAHQASQHANVSCVECHTGRLSTFKSMSTKITHTKHLWNLITGYERPLTSPSMPASGKSCERCHSNQSHTNDSVRVLKHYASDEENTETTIRLTMRTAGTFAREDGGQGIHWHSETGTRVRFIATDKQNQNIPWVKATWPDGKTVVYTDVTQPLTDDQIAHSEKKEMECTDCHNRVGHHFVNPEAILDHALATGWLNRRLPFIKSRLKNLLDEEYETKEDALNLFKEASEQYLRDFPNIPQDFPEDFARSMEFASERQKSYANWLIRSRFRHPGVSWQSFQDLSGHKYTPGCFRCHSGKHYDDKGNPISVNCTTCHNVPFIRHEREPMSWRKKPSLGNLKPRSHKQSDFILKHRELEGESCKTCHGIIRYGTDNKSFCANSACHATKWPGLDLQTNIIRTK
jgi:hypothetical protein